LTLIFRQGRIKYMKLPSKKLRVIIFIILIVLIILLFSFFSQEIKSFFYFISSPFQKILWGTGDIISDFFEGISRAGALDGGIDQLRIENKELLAQIAILNKLKDENKFLRDALSINLEKDFNLFLGQIIGKDISQDFLLIDKGSDHGLKENMIVITEEKVLLGRISELYNKFSKVMLISHNKSSFDVDIAKRDVCAIAKGKGDLNVFLDFIPWNKEISPGDIVTTSSLGGVFPAGLLVGEIIKVKKNDVESFQQAEVKLSFDIEEINYLFVITEY